MAFMVPTPPELYPRSTILVFGHALSRIIVSMRNGEKGLPIEDDDDDGDGDGDDGEGVR